MAGRDKLTVYLVRRLGWEYGDDFYYRTEAEDAPLETFLDCGKAEARRRELEWQYVCERGVNPFGWIDGGLEERTSLSPEEFLARMRQVGLPADRGLSHLWGHYDELTEQQRRLVWEAVDRLRFFEVVEMTVDLEG
jgi:hypothetical protein